MINLIPKEEKRKIAKVFYYRLAVVYLLTLSFSVLIGTVAIVPSYFLTKIKKDSIDKKLEIQKAEPAPLLEEKTRAIIKDLNLKLSLFENKKNNEFIVSQKIINAIILKKISGIKITDISYEDNYQNNSIPLQNKKVSIRGIAPSREVLLLFRKALEDDVTFKSVNLPISNFIKGSNIQFYLNLIPNSNDNSVEKVLQ